MFHIRISVVMMIGVVCYYAHADSAQSLFGYPLASSIGIAACPLTVNSEGVRKMAERGFDLITYKTIRTVAMPIKSPVMYRVDVHEQLTHECIGSRVCIIDHEPTQEDRAITNLYGIGSLDAGETIADIKKAHALLPEGKLLIVSIYGSGNNMDEQTQDFVQAAQIAAAGGAQIIEANLSCPNLATNKLMYKDPELVHAVCSAIKSALPNIHLIIKVGVFDDDAQMREAIRAAYRGGARGICGINTVPMRVVNAQGDPVYGAGREISGLSGEPIRELALEFTRNARAIITQEHMDMILLATGGVMNAHDYDAFIAAGADVVLCATAALIKSALD